MDQYLDVYELVAQRYIYIYIAIDCNVSSTILEHTVAMSESARSKTLPTSISYFL